MNEQSRQTIYCFMLHELSEMSKNVADNYQKNKAQRSRNPFLGFKDPSAEKYMGLGRSIDSQLGNRMQNIIFYLARLRYSGEYVPNIINIKTNSVQNKVEMELYSVKGDIDRSYYRVGTNPCRQNVYLNKELDLMAVRSLLNIKVRSKCQIIRKSFTFSGVSPSFFLNIQSLQNNQSLKEETPVDLIVFSPGMEQELKCSTFEIKMGGNLDTKNAKSNADEVKLLYELFSFMENESFFATCYGTCSESVTSRVRALSGNCSVLSAPKFWSLVLPDGKEKLSYDDFIKLYTNAFIKSGLEERIISL